MPRHRVLIVTRLKEKKAAADRQGTDQHAGYYRLPSRASDDIAQRHADEHTDHHAQCDQPAPGKLQKLQMRRVLPDRFAEGQLQQKNKRKGGRKRDSHSTAGTLFPRQVGCNGGHGKLWLDEMLRLTKMGAPTAKDYEAYKAHQDGERTALHPHSLLHRKGCCHSERKVTCRR